ncbi:hypothetical protein NUSPORA_01114 [Nucleospora cyclopteri]
MTKNTKSEKVKLHMFRDLFADYSPITSMCNNKDTLVIFRANKAMELLCMVTLKMYARIGLPSVIRESSFVSDTKIRMLSTKNTLEEADLTDLSAAPKIFVKNATSMSLYANKLNCSSINSEQNLIYVTDHKTVCNGGKPIFRSKTNICRVFNFSDLLIGCEDKTVKIIKKGEIAQETEFEGILTDLIELKTGLYASVDNEGFFYIFDRQCRILDKLRVRKTRLNSLAEGENEIHTGGEDSRIISIQIDSKNKLKVIAQNSVHSDEIVQLISTGKFIFTAGKDSLLVRNNFDGEKYKSTRIFEENITAIKNNQQTFSIITDKNLSVYKITENTAKDETISATNSYLINYFLKFDFDHFNIISAADVSQDAKFLAFGWRSKIFLYRLQDESGRISVEKIREFPGGFRLKFISGRFLCILHWNCSTTVFDLEECKIVKNKLPPVSLRSFFTKEEGQISLFDCGQETIQDIKFVGKQTKHISTEGQISLFDCGQETIQDIKFVGKQIKHISKEGQISLFDCGQEYLCGIRKEDFVIEKGNQTIISIKHQIVSGVVFDKSIIILYNPRFLQVYNKSEGEISKYDLEFHIRRCLIMNENEILVIQTCYDKICRNISKKKVEKYRNK